MTAVCRFLGKWQNFHKSFSQDKHSVESILAILILFLEVGFWFFGVFFEFCVEISIPLKTLLLSIANRAKITIIIPVIVAADI